VGQHDCPGKRHGGRTEPATKIDPPPLAHCSFVRSAFSGEHPFSSCTAPPFSINWDQGTRSIEIRCSSVSSSFDFFFSFLVDFHPDCESGSSVKKLRCDYRRCAPPIPHFIWSFIHFSSSVTHVCFFSLVFL